MYYQIDPVTAPIALEIFKRYEAGETMKPIMDAIYIFDDRIVFTLNYKDGAKTVTLIDIESSDLSIVDVPIYKGVPAELPCILLQV
jgi:hypothetical protein